MHMRRKKWARPELAECPWYTGEPERFSGKWAAQFVRRQPLHLELGCGKGVSTALLAADHPEWNFVAIDLSPDVLGDARRNIVEARKGSDVDNIWLVWGNIEQVSSFFTEEDAVSRIYINFCNPWPRRRHEKRRLTHPRQLAQYRRFLCDGGEIWFKTDNEALFEASLQYFALSGFSLQYRTDDLHSSGFQPNYVSEHEAFFSAQGIPIHFGIFRKETEGLRFDPLRWHLEDSVEPQPVSEEN